MILKIFNLKFFRYLIRRRFTLRHKFFSLEKNFFLKIKTLKMKIFKKKFNKIF